MTTAYSYVRVSSKKQTADDRHGIQRQTDSTEKYCKEHGLTLDTKLNLKDLGVSAHKIKDPDQIAQGNLNTFLKAIEEGHVKKGSVLVVEHLDRLSRKHVLKAFKLFSTILEAGVKIVTLMDKMEYTEESVNDNPGQLFTSIGMMMAANKYSETLRERVGAAWRKKRKVLAEGFAKPITGKCPTWMTYDGNKFQLHPERLPVVKRIVAMTTQGVGCVGISRRLNQDHVPTFTKRSRRWDQCTIRHIITSRALMGEFQPRRMVDDDGKPFADGRPVADGKPVQGYYPAAITQEVWYAMQAAVNARKTNVKGRQGKFITNLFGRILTSGQDGSRMQMHSASSGQKTLHSHAAQQGAAKTPGFNYAAFEGAFLKWVTEVELKSSKAGTSRVEELRGRMAVADGKIKKLQAAMLADDGDGVDALVASLKQVQVQRRELNEELEYEVAKEHKPQVGTGDIAKMVKQAAGLPEAERNELRQKIKAAIQGVCEEIRMFVYVEKQVRVCVAHVMMVDGSDRVFAVRWTQGARVGQPSRWETISDNLVAKVPAGVTQERYGQIVAEWIDRIGPELLAA